MAKLVGNFISLAIFIYKCIAQCRLHFTYQQSLQKTIKCNSANELLIIKYNKVKNISVLLVTGSNKEFSNGLQLKN